MKVLFAMLDDAGADAFTYMPFVNSMRQHGTTFTRAYATVPLCAPARTGIMTGLMPGDSTVFSNGGVQAALDADVFTYSDMLGPRLEAVGVPAALLGKWGVGPNDQDFDDWSTIHQIYGGDVQNVPHGFQCWDGTDVTVVNDWHHAHFAEEAIAHVDAATDDWFVYWATTAPHWPWSPVPGNPFAFSDVAELAPIPDQDGTGWPSWIASRTPITGGGSWNEVVSFKRQMARELLDFDNHLRVLWDHIVAEGQADDTLLIVTSDNGIQHGQHRIQGAASKNTCYEESARVPMMMVGPGVPADQTVDALVMHQDITKTVYAATGATPSLGNQAGVNLLPVTANPAAYADRSVLVQVRPDGTDTVPFPADAIVTPTAKLIHHTGADPADEWELYDLVNDPGELVNVAGESEWAATRSTLEAALAALL